MLNSNFHLKLIFHLDQYWTLTLGFPWPQNPVHSDPLIFFLFWPHKFVHLVFLLQSTREFHDLHVQNPGDSPVKLLHIHFFECGSEIILEKKKKRLVSFYCLWNYKNAPENFLLLVLLAKTPVIMLSCTRTFSVPTVSFYYHHKGFKQIWYKGFVRWPWYAAVLLISV